MHTKGILTMNKDLLAIFEYLEREKGIKREVIISAVEESLLAAARKKASRVSSTSMSTSTIKPATLSLQLRKKLSKR